MTGCERMGPLLGGYRDRELGLLGRWRVERHLSRCPACRGEVAELGRAGAWVRDALGPAPDPDLWAALAARLPRALPQAEAPGRRRPIALPFAGAALAAAAAAAFLLAPPGTFTSGIEEVGVVVRSINAHGRSVMVLDGTTDATIIWLMDEAGSEQPEEAVSVWI
jgi:anti-sigma factor RsiW